MRTLFTPWRTHHGLEQLSRWSNTEFSAGKHRKVETYGKFTGNGDVVEHVSMFVCLGFFKNLCKIGQQKVVRVIKVIRVVCAGRGLPVREWILVF